jgi:protein-S-isoprenylcysteine O-methyltransferase Ste14
MVSHLFFLVIFAVLVSTVFAVLQKDSPAEQVKLAALMAASFVGIAVVAGWVMLLFPLW